MSGNPNENCLLGFECQECGSFGPFRVEVTTMMELTDAGSLHHGDFDYEGDSRCECMTCDHSAKVRDFLPVHKCPIECGRQEKLL